jgi:hypothetical protein
MHEINPQDENTTSPKGLVRFTGIGKCAGLSRG